MHLPRIGITPGDPAGIGPDICLQAFQEFEAEAELVAGYFTEYSAMGFALFFLGEYSNMILMSTITSLCFFGG